MRQGRLILPASLLLLLIAAPVAGAAECSVPTEPYTAEYDLYRNGDVVGTTTIRLGRHDDGTYSYDVDSKAERGFVGLLGAHFFEHSDWIPNGDRPRPLVYKRGQDVAFSHRRYDAFFNWNERTAHGKARDRAWVADSLPADTLDDVLVNLALMTDLRCGVHPLRYNVLDKGHLEDWAFDRQGRQQMDTPAGTFRTIKVARRHDSPDRQSLSWHAPELGYLAVRIEHVDGAGKDRFAMTLKRLTPGADGKPLADTE